MYKTMNKARDSHMYLQCFSYTRNDTKYDLVEFISILVTELQKCLQWYHDDSFLFFAHCNLEIFLNGLLLLIIVIRKNASLNFLSNKF